MKFTCCLLAVKDISASRKFYEELFGLTVLSDYGINIAFDCGLALQQEFDWLTGVPKNEILSKSNNFELCFEEKEFDNFLARLKTHNLTMLHPVQEHGWGQRVIRFYDPDNHIIEVGENMKDVVERFLSQGLSKDETAKRMDVSTKDIDQILSEV